MTHRLRIAIEQMAALRAYHEWFAKQALELADALVHLCLHLAEHERTQPKGFADGTEVDRGLGAEVSIERCPQGESCRADRVSTPQSGHGGPCVPLQSAPISKPAPPPGDDNFGDDGRSLAEVLDDCANAKGALTPTGYRSAAARIRELETRVGMAFCDGWRVGFDAAQPGEAGRVPDTGQRVAPVAPPSSDELPTILLGCARTARADGLLDTAAACERAAERIRELDKVRLMLIEERDAWKGEAMANRELAAFRRQVAEQPGKNSCE